MVSGFFGLDFGLRISGIWFRGFWAPSWRNGSINFWGKVSANWGGGSFCPTKVP